MKSSLPIYIVEDDKNLNLLIQKYLENEGYTKLHGFYSGEDLFEHIENDEQAIVVQDIELPGMDGISVIKKAKKDYKGLDFIFLSGQHSIEVALQSIKLGAFDYIVKNRHSPENVLLKIKHLTTMHTLEERKKDSNIIKIIALILFISSCIVALLLL